MKKDDLTNNDKIEFATIKGMLTGVLCEFDCLSRSRHVEVKRV